MEEGFIFCNEKIISFITEKCNIETPEVFPGGQTFTLYATLISAQLYNSSGQGEIPYRR